MGLEPRIYPPAAILAAKMINYSLNWLKAQAAQITMHSHQTEDELPLEERLTVETRTELNFDSDETVLLVEIRPEVLASSDLSDQGQRRVVDHGLPERKKRCHWTSVTRCTCQYEECMGVPCRHMLNVAMISRFVGPLRCDPFWPKKITNAENDTVSSLRQYNKTYTGKCRYHSIDSGNKARIVDADFWCCCRYCMCVDESDS